MKRFSFTQLVIFLLVFLAGANVCEGQLSGQRAAVKAEKSLSGTSRARKRQSKIKEPKKVVEAKKAQDEKKKKADSDYNDYVKKSQTRAVAIQSPAVQERMKQNKKDIEEREKAKKKKSVSTTGKAGRKYK